ncbi:MAG TPA: dienelactone hydrolase family protein [Gemmatimonadaceae bacterium]|nr:dienelactone hydrolase family protein [Gemmatimonadaceae bacterium]
MPVGVRSTKGFACVAAAAALAACAGTTGAVVAPANPVEAVAPGAATVRERLLASPRHGEWAMIRTGPTDSVRAWVVYPERSSKAPVVVVVHEIFGLSTWIRGVADQLAAAGFIAIAPDLLTGKATLEGDTLPNSVATTAIRTLRAEDVQRQLEAVAQYGMALPAAAGRYGIVGFCWGGGTSFAHAVRSPSGLKGAVVYYGASPDTTELSRVQVPVLGLYAGDDARINARVPATDSTMRRLGKPYEVHFFEGAGHGFLRAQDGREANRAAAEKAWPMTVAFFRRNLGR